MAEMKRDQKRRKQGDLQLNTERQMPPTARAHGESLDASIQNDPILMLVLDAARGAGATTQVAGEFDRPMSPEGSQRNFGRDLLEELVTYQMRGNARGSSLSARTPAGRLASSMAGEGDVDSYLRGDSDEFQLSAGRLKRLRDMADMMLNLLNTQPDAGQSAARF